jgi:hypothetical protein
MVCANSPLDRHVLYFAILIVQGLNYGINSSRSCVIVVQQEVRLSRPEHLEEVSQQLTLWSTGQHASPAASRSTT